MWIVLASVALGASPTLDAHLLGSVAEPTLGLGGAVGFPLLERLDADLNLEGALGPRAWLVAAQPRLRWYLGPLSQPVVHLEAGVGTWVEEGVHPLMSLGAGLDLGTRATRPRLTAAYWWGPGGPPWRAALTLGLTHRRPQAPVAPAPEPAPAPPEPAPSPPAEIPLNAAMVWVPGPVCEWLPPDQASSAFERVSARPQAFATLSQPPPAVAQEGTEEAKALGDLVISALPGDQVSVNGRASPIDADGIAVSKQPEGPATVEVKGAGRAQQIPIGVAAGSTVWVDIWADTPPPGPIQISFLVGSSVLTPTARAQVREFADTLGDWTVSVHGSYSPEGNLEANLALGEARAAATRAALLEAGLPEGRVLLLPPEPPVPGLPAPKQRAAVLTPVEATP